MLWSSQRPVGPLSSANPAAFAHAAHLEKRLAEGADVPPNPPPAASNPPTRSRLAQLSPGSSLGAGAALPRLQRVVDGQLALEDTRRVRATPAERPGGETYGRGAPPEFASAAAGTTSERRLCSQNRAARAIQGNQRSAAPAKQAEPRVLVEEAGNPLLPSVWFFGAAELTTICCTIPSPERRGQLQSELWQGLETAGTEQCPCRRGMQRGTCKGCILCLDRGGY